MHHVCPRSRAKNQINGKKIRLYKNFHKAWHSIFGNLYGLECQRFLALLMTEMHMANRINNNRIQELRSLARIYPNSIDLDSIPKIRADIKYTSKNITELL